MIFIKNFFKRISINYQAKEFEKLQIQYAEVVTGIFAKRFHNKKFNTNTKIPWEEVLEYKGIKIDNYFPGFNEALEKIDNVNTCSIIWKDDKSFYYLQFTKQSLQPDTNAEFLQFIFKNNFKEKILYKLTDEEFGKKIVKVYYFTKYTPTSEDLATMAILKFF